MSKTLVSQQLSLPTLPDTELSHMNSIMSGVSSSMPDFLEGSTESFSGNPMTEQLPLSSMPSHSVDCYPTSNTLVGQEMLISYNQNGQSESMPENVAKQQFTMPTKRKATTDLIPERQGSQKMSTPNKRVAQMGSSFAKVGPGMVEHSGTNRKSSLNSPRSSASGKKVMQVEPVAGKSQSTHSKRNAQPQQSQVSPKAQTSDACESVRAKLRESLASALALVSQQRESSSDGKMKTESEDGVRDQKPPASSSGSVNLEPASIVGPTDGCNDVKNTSREIHSKELHEGGSHSSSFVGSDFQSSSALSGEEMSFGDSFFLKDDLLQGNGLSWDLDFNPHMEEVKEVEHTEMPQLMKEDVSSHEKEEQKVQSPESVAFEIETELFKLFGGVNKKYKEKGRSLLFNLKDRNNPELREKVMSGEIPPERLCSMTAEELASKELSQWRIAKAEELDHMKVLPDEEANMRRLVKKTHKGEYQVIFEPEIGASEEISLGTSLPVQNRAQVKSKDAGSPPKTKKTKADQDNQCEITISGDGADMQGLMVDDMRDLPPIVSLDEFMESLDKEPPFDNIAVDHGRKTPESDKENSGMGSESRSPVQPLKTPEEVKSPKSDKVDVVSMKPDGDMKLTDNQKGTDASVVVHPPKGERVWEGILQLTISSMANFVAIYKSGEKPSTKEWSGYFDIKGRVRLDAFDKFLQALPMSRTRAIMVCHFALKEGSTETDLANLDEVVASYVSDQRLGFAEPAPGVELYLCPHHSSLLDVVINNLPKRFTEKINNLDNNGLIGIIVWRKHQLTSPPSSLISPDSSQLHKDNMMNKRPFSRLGENDVNKNVGFGSRNAPTPPNLSRTQVDDDDDGDDVPPGFGPCGSRDDEDLPEFNFSNPNPNTPNPSRFSGSGRDAGLSSSRLNPHQGPARQVEQMRELIQKYGQNGTNPRVDPGSQTPGRQIPIQIQPWNDDEDDDIPEWQPQTTYNPPPQPPPQQPVLYQEPPPPPQLPPQQYGHNQVLPPPHMVNAPPFPWPPLGQVPPQQLQPLQPPMRVHPQGAWPPPPPPPYGPNNVGSQQHGGQFYGRPPNSSNNNRGF